VITKPYPRPKKPPKPPKEPKIYRRRRCQLETCNILFRPIRSNQRFCCLAHKHDFHFKTPTFRKTEREIVKLVKAEVVRHLPRIERQIWLKLEADPPPGLVARITEGFLKRQ
jgi:hypothetical protein